MHPLQLQQQLQRSNFPGRENNLYERMIKRMKQKQQQQQQQQHQQYFRTDLKNNNNHIRIFRRNRKIHTLNTENNGGQSKTQRQAEKSTVASKFKSFIIKFLEHSSIHGLKYLAMAGLSVVERTLWLAFIFTAICGIISLSHRTWHRFQTSPMVISMDRNKLIWNTTFPSVTICPHKRFDELRLESYILSNPDIYYEEEAITDFKNFINKLAHLSYDNIDQLPLNRSFGIAGDEYLDLLHELKYDFEPEVSSATSTEMVMYETQTEFGICYSVNSLLARYNSYEYWKSNDWAWLEHGELVKVHSLDGEIYAQLVNLSTGYDVYFHSSNDIPSISKQIYTFSEGHYATVELTALEIYTDEAAKDFSSSQRLCRFMHEAENMLTTPVYSFGLCLAECRLFLALKACGCVPHFYRNTLRNGDVLPVCGLKGLSCVAGLKNEIRSLKSDRYKIKCNCLPNCDDSNFFVQSYRSRVWFLGGNLQWGIIEHPKMKLRREVIFSFADVLVSIGGMVGFLLGCSALSLMEVLYYFTVRFVRRMMS